MKKTLASMLDGEHRQKRASLICRLVKRRYPIDLTRFEIWQVIKEYGIDPRDATARGLHIEFDDNGAISLDQETIVLRGCAFCMGAGPSNVYRA